MHAQHLADILLFSFEKFIKFLKIAQILPGGNPGGGGVEFESGAREQCLSSDQRSGISAPTVFAQTFIKRLSTK